MNGRMRIPQRQNRRLSRAALAFVAVALLLPACGAAPAVLPPAPAALQPATARPPETAVPTETALPSATLAPTATPTNTATFTPQPAPSYTPLSENFLLAQREAITARNASRLQAGQRLLIDPHAASSFALDFSVTKYQFFVRYRQGGDAGDGYLRAYDLQSGAQLFAMDPWAGSPPPDNIAFSSDRVRFATWNTSDDPVEVTLWDTIRGEKISSFQAPSGRLGFSPNLETYAAAEKTPDSAIISVRVLNVRTQKEIYNTSLLGWIRDCTVAFSPDGAYLVVARGSGNVDGLVTVLKAKTGDEVNIIYNQHFSGFSPDGRTFLGTYKQNTIRIFNTSAAKWTRDVPVVVYGEVWAGYSPDGKLLLAHLPGNKIQIIDIATARAVFAPKDRIDGAWFSGDGTILLTYTADPDRTALVFWTVGPG